jgi:outer membrane protein assembly factor BamD (BamD/ComL family)
MSISLLFAWLLLAQGQESPVQSCDSGESKTLEQSARTSLDGKNYQSAVQQFQAAYSACPSRRFLLLDLSRAASLARDSQNAIRFAEEYLK